MIKLKVKGYRITEYLHLQWACPPLEDSLSSEARRESIRQQTTKLPGDGGHTQNSYSLCLIKIKLLGIPTKGKVKTHIKVDHDQVQLGLVGN